MRLTEYKTKQRQNWSLAVNLRLAMGTKSSSGLYQSGGLRWSSFMNTFVSWAEIIWWSTRRSWGWLMVSLSTSLNL